jgi:murein DD-endopeptidase MepM/ murein hydrolase activator NlpD
MAKHRGWQLKRQLGWYQGAVLIGLLGVGLGQSPVKAETALCPQSALSQVIQHRVAPGETLAQIASQYSLLPTTLMGINPALRNGAAPTVGQMLQIPPFNGIAVDVSQGSTWQTLAEQYRVGADVLFEANGCQATVPRRIFIPGANWFPGFNATTASQSTNLLRGYPLPATAPVLISYGWQPHPYRDEVVFNSGIALLAPPGSQVLAVGDGTVAFTGPQGEYGNLVVVNHAQGLQTRYANLGEISVSVGQNVSVGEQLGRVDTNSEAPATTFLYFEVRTSSDMGWVARDPRQFVPALEQQ